MTRFFKFTKSERGVSMVDMMVTLAIMATLAGMATVRGATVRRSLQSDGAMRIVMSQLVAAREMAITQRRNMEVQFASVIGTGRIRTIRREVPGPATTLLREVYLEGGAEFVLIPSITTDTPDHFGNGNAISFGAATAIMFGTDGSLLDGAGNPINGTVFVSVHGLPQTQRAITVLGTLGRVRGYRWVQPNQGTSAWSRV